MSGHRSERLRISQELPPGYQKIDLSGGLRWTRLAAIGTLPVYLCEEGDPPVARFKISWDGRQGNPRMNLFDIDPCKSSDQGSPAIARYLNRLRRNPGDQTEEYPVTNGAVQLRYSELGVVTAGLAANISAAGRINPFGDHGDVGIYEINRPPEYDTTLVILAPSSQMVTPLQDWLLPETHDPYTGGM